jgi:hypothetical protein
MPPMHDFQCPTGHVFTAYQPLDKLDATMACAQCKAMADKVFLKAPMGFVKMDVHYTSPVDGRPITSWNEHVEELARTDTIVYEPGIKQDQERNQRMRDEALEKAVDETVEREVATMPARKKEKLAAELEGGLTADVQRVTPAQISYKEA